MPHVHVTCYMYMCYSWYIITSQFVDIEVTLYNSRLQAIKENWIRWELNPGILNSRQELFQLIHWQAKALKHTIYNTSTVDDITVLSKLKDVQF